MEVGEDPVELLREVVEHVRVSRTAAESHPLWSRVFATIDAASLSVDELVDKLDARCAETGERWDVYRAAVGGWIANARDRHESGSSDPAALSVRASTISEASTPGLGTAAPSTPGASRTVGARPPFRPCRRDGRRPAGAATALDGPMGYR